MPTVFASVTGELVMGLSLDEWGADMNFEDTIIAAKAKITIQSLIVEARLFCDLRLPGQPCF